MGVYIPGMETPTNCHECDSWGLSDVVMIDCPVDKDGGLYSYTDRPEGCPLVPVPPHGRLIDADEMDDLLADKSEDAYNQTHAPRSWERALSVMRDYLEDAPTIIPASTADKEGNCPSCIHDEYECQYSRTWTLMDFCEKIEYIGYVPAADVVPGSDFRDCRNELCLRCGQYKTAHLGSCDGCRWRH